MEFSLWGKKGAGEFGRKHPGLPCILKKTWQDHQGILQPKWAVWWVLFFLEINSFFKVKTFVKKKKYAIGDFSGLESILLILSSKQSLTGNSYKCNLFIYLLLQAAGSKRTIMWLHFHIAVRANSLPTTRFSFFFPHHRQKRKSNNLLMSIWWSVMNTV